MNKPAQELVAKPARKKRVKALAPASEPITPMQMLGIAVQQNADIEKMKQLMELERQWKADRAREAFYEALAAFKKVSVIVTKDKINKQYNSRYVGIGNMVNTVNAAMAPFGLNARWDFKQAETITVTCILSHTMGHSESVSLSGPPDTSGAKNSLQQIKSTVTYLESATYQAVTGIVSSDEDDDGNGAVAYITESQCADLNALLDEVKADKSAFCRYFKIDSIPKLPAQAYSMAVAMVEVKRKQPAKKSEK